MTRDDEPDGYEDQDLPPDELMPHRGGVVLTCGIVSIVLAVTTVLFCFTFMIGLPLGIMAWRWGGKDLRRMHEGVMDPEGKGATNGGYICGIIGTLLNAFVLVLVLAYVAILGGLFAIGGFN